jgi:hypothetical protein
MLYEYDTLNGTAKSELITFTRVSFRGAKFTTQP